jgi:hypothetical protein
MDSLWRSIDELMGGGRVPSPSGVVRLMTTKFQRFFEDVIAAVCTSTDVAQPTALHFRSARPLAGCLTATDI